MNVKAELLREYRLAVQEADWSIGGDRAELIEKVADIRNRLIFVGGQRDLQLAELEDVADRLSYDTYEYRRSTSTIYVCFGFGGYFVSPTPGGSRTIGVLYLTTQIQAYYDIKGLLRPFFVDSF